MSVPSGNSVAALLLLRLAKRVDNDDYFEKARQVLEAVAPLVARQPRAFTHMLCSVDFYLRPPAEIAIIGHAGAPDTQRLLKMVRTSFLPRKIVAFLDPAGGDSATTARRVPLLANRKMVSGSATAYVCENFICKQPVTEPKQFAVLLGLGPVRRADAP